MEEGRSATFTPTSFAQGRFRRAYKGVWTAPIWDRGKPCVVKELKESYTWRPEDWTETIDINKRAKYLSANFTIQKLIPYNTSISYTDVHVSQVSSTCNPYTTPKLNEYVTCEDYIPGHFTKWCNNYGYISSESTIHPAFMHWSWIQTRGEEMISDLQGVQNGNSYTLTDAAMLSLSGKYGVTDTGVEGMAMFFLKHNCNSLCQGLSKPTLAHFHRIIPQPYLLAAETLLGQVQSSTTYSFELKFPQAIKGRVEAKFREIACN